MWLGPRLDQMAHADVVVRPPGEELINKLLSAKTIAVALGAVGEVSRGDLVRQTVDRSVGQLIPGDEALEVFTIGEHGEDGAEYGAAMLEGILVTAHGIQREHQMSVSVDEPGSQGGLATAQIGELTQRGGGQRSVAINTEVVGLEERVELVLDLVGSWAVEGLQADCGKTLAEGVLAHRIKADLAPGNVRAEGGDKLPLIGLPRIVWLGFRGG